MELCWRLRSWKHRSNIFIWSMLHGGGTGAELGGDDFLTKPSNRTKFMVGYQRANIRRVQDDAPQVSPALAVVAHCAAFNAGPLKTGVGA